MDMSRDRGGRSDFASTGDWRSGPRTEGSDMDRDRRSYRDSNRERDRDREGNKN